MGGNGKRLLKCDSCGKTPKEVGMLHRKGEGALCGTCRHKLKWNGKPVDISPAEDWKFS